MNDSGPNQTGVRAAFRANLVNIVLSVISIIQGLAFNDLANRFSKIYDLGFQSEKLALIAHFLLCFALLLRIFQTYVTAALDYQRWNLGFFDLLAIFVIGLMEYFVFSALDPAKNFDANVFHSRLIILSAFACLAYTRALIVLHRSRFTQDAYYSEYHEYEMRLQLVNLLGSLFLVGVSIYAIFMRTRSDFAVTTLGIFGFLSLIGNMYYSINSTFHRSVIHSETLPFSKLAIRQELDGSLGNIEIRTATKSDIDELLEIFMGSFHYVYENLFDTSPRLTRKILRSVLASFGGRHELGFRQFSVAIDLDTRKVVGILRFERAKTGISFQRAFSLLVLGFNVIVNIGIVGLFRVLRNSRRVQSASYPIFRSNELHLHYLAVDAESREKGIGPQLIRFTLAQAKLMGNNFVALEVRETNRRARQFFKRMGFVEEIRIKSEYDHLFGKGARIRMRKPVEG